MRAGQRDYASSWKLIAEGIRPQTFPALFFFFFFKGGRRVSHVFGMQLK